MSRRKSLRQIRQTTIRTDVQKFSCAMTTASSRIGVEKEFSRFAVCLLLRCGAMANATNIECKQAAGVFAPIIDRNRCEGKEDCVQVCPYDVFEMRKLSAENKRALPFVSRVKALVHRNWQSFAV